MQVNNQMYSMKQEHAKELEHLRVELGRQCEEKLESMRIHYYNEEKKAKEQVYELNKGFGKFQSILQTGMKVIRASHEEGRPVRQDEYDEFMSIAALPQIKKTVPLNKLPANRLINMIERFEKQTQEQIMQD